MSDDQDNNARDESPDSGAIVVRPDRPGGKLRKNQGRGARNLARKWQPSVPVPAPEPSVPMEPAEPKGPAIPLTPSGGDAAQYAQLLLTMQRSRKRRFLWRLALFVVVPTLVTFLYTFFWATPRYVSEAEVTYQMYQPLKSMSSGLVESILGTSQTSNIDIGTIVYEYVRSAALLTKLEAKLHLRSYYSNPKFEYFSRLSSNASSEKFLRYYRRHVAISEGLGGYLTITVTAFDAQFAVTLAKAVVQECDDMVANITMRARQNEVRAGETEVSRQEDRIRRARKALTDFQNAHGDLDPQRVATQLGQITGNLESQLATARTELANTLAYMKADAPRVVQLKYLISALEQQLKQEQARLANTGGSVPYSQILDEYSALQLEEDFAQKAYLAAQQSLALARADADRQQTYLVDFAPPSQPDRATQYYPLYTTLTAFVVSLLAFGIGSLMVGALRDQAGI